jgi:hypothetical protein
LRKKISSKFGKFAAFAVWLYVRQTPMLEKAFYSKTSSIERHFLKGIFHQHTAHHFLDIIVTLIILAQYAKG